ncbi:MAG: glycosyltransferase family 2 protein [Paracoccaceae bacterium]
MSAPKEPLLLTIILNYKTAPMTLISAEAAITAMAGIAGEILIVDNDSQDCSFETIAAHIAAQGWDKSIPKVRVIQSSHNGGFGAGNNFGIRTGLSDGALPDFIYVLNPDAFPEKSAIKALLEYMKTHPRTGLAGSYIHGENRDTHLTTFRFPSIMSEFEGAAHLGLVSRLLNSRKLCIETPKQAQQVDWLAGASLMIRKSALDEIGLFDETFFLYFEETDLSRRAAQAGWYTCFVPDSKVVHIGSVSTGMKTWNRVPEYWFDSRLHYLVKTHGVLYTVFATLAHLTGGFMHWLRCLITGKERHVAHHFLITLATHDGKALIRAIFRRSLGAPKITPPQPECKT